MPDGAVPHAGIPALDRRHQAPARLRAARIAEMGELLKAGHKQRPQD